jgi:hypothetical protein|tara:strand:+ start:93 stop:326 length:234 start_codon:yes stop_codon:yes gene_type:complete
MDPWEKAFKDKIDLVGEINRIKHEMLEIAISGLTAIKQQGNPIAENTLKEMVSAIPQELQLDINKQIEKALRLDDEI